MAAEGSPGELKEQRGKGRRRPVAEPGKSVGTLLPLPTSGRRTHVFALTDQFLLLTLEIKIKCITIDQFSRIQYICFGDVKRTEYHLSAY